MEAKNEIWKSIKGFEGRYEISNMGRIRGLDRWSLGKRPVFVRGKMLKNSLNGRKGYYRVSLSDGRRNYKHFEVHRLVALHFVEGYKKGLVVNHINKIKTDNRAENLEWVSYQYNLTYSDVVAWKRKPVYQYDLDGNFIKKFKCCSEAEKMFGKYQGAMVHVMYESKTGIWEGYRWSFQYHPPECWKLIDKTFKTSKKPVIQMNDDCVEIERFPSITKAAAAMGISINAISRAIHHRGKIRAGGFKWKFAN